jgi:hypothetical protein
MSEQQTGFADFLQTAKEATAELGPPISEEGEFLRLNDGQKIDLEFRLDMKCHVVDKPATDKYPARKQIRFYTYELDSKGAQVRKIVWDTSKRDSNTIVKTIEEENTNQLEIKRMGTDTNTRYMIYPFHPKG